MKSTAVNPQMYLDALPEERKEAMTKLRDTINENLPKGFKEIIQYGMIGYVVPHEIYPDGYHCNPKTPLPFMCMASQKNFISFHHLGIYAMPGILQWFINEYSMHSKTKPDMGKGCVRFKNQADIPFELIGELVKKISVKDWVTTYEKNIKK